MITNQRKIQPDHPTRIHLECLHHLSHSKWAYSYDKDVFHLRVRTKRGDVDRAFALTGDKYDWKSFHHEHPMRKVASDRFFDYWQAGVTPDHRRFSYAFRFHAGQETVWLTETGVYTEEPEAPDGFFDQPYVHVIDMFDPPAWAKSAVFYQIMPDRFANGDPDNDPEETSEWGDTPTRESFFGGDLQGIISKLDYLADLGITALYLTPIFEAPTNHKYDTLNYKKVDPHFGDLELLKQLVQEAHAKGIRVVLDAVFNHIGADSPQFQDVVKHGKQSKYANWFHIHSFPVEVREDRPNYDAFGFFPQMPKLNTANPETREYLLDIAEYWLKEIGMDGWRLDVANEIDHTFWREFRKRIKAINPEAYIIGEVWTDSLRWLDGDQFDSVMNYPLSDRLLEYLGDESLNADTFAAYIGHLLMRYPQQANEVMFNLLASHDTARLLTQLGGDKRKLKLAAAFLFTFTGTPCIFYGDEIGLEGEGDPDCRKCMLWEEEQQDRDLLLSYRELIRLRHQHPALSTGEFGFLRAREDERAFIYERFDKEEHLTVWMNPSGQTVRLSLKLEGQWRDALTGQPADSAKGLAQGLVQVELAPYGYAILKKA